MPEGALEVFGWGTLTPRVSFEYQRAESSFEFGEWAVEYLKRVSDKLRIVTTVEGESDEFQLIGEVQVWITPRAFA